MSKFRLTDAAVTAACLGPDLKQIAFSPNSHQVFIADISSPKCEDWTVVGSLSGHDSAVTSIQWHPATGKILTCAHDRAAFVWNRGENNQWCPTMIVLDAQVKRGLTCAAWSRSGEKIYLGSAAANIAVGKFDPEGNWWRCALASPHCSGITAMAAHPINDAFIATGGNDCCVKFVSTWTKGIDDPTVKLGKVGTEIGAYQLAAWISALSWTPSGNMLAVATRDSSVCLLSGDASAMADWSMIVIPLRGLPLRAISFLSDTSFIAAGHDFFPILFNQISGEEESPTGGWTLTKIGANQKKQEKKLTETQAARLKWQNQAKFGQSESIDLPETRHTNTIVGILPLVGRVTKDSNPVLKQSMFATFSLDGRIEFWNDNDLLAP